MPKRSLHDFIGDEGCMPIIMGPTASGKSALALKIASICNGEIISADSMQFYRGLEIGVAKPTADEQHSVPHHLLDILDITEKYDIFRFCADAENAITDIRDRGRLPIIAGGSGLYLRALIYGLDPLPAKQSLRDELDAKYDNEEHFPELISFMQEHCPDDCAKFYQHRRKLIRACEVYLLSGQQITTLQNVQKNKKPRPDAKSFVLVWDRDILKQRIRQRAEEMLNGGWIEEAKDLIGKGLLQTPTAWQALGYSLIAKYLAGEMSRSELPEAISIATWQFARRQITWFAHQHPEAEFIPMPCDLCTE